MPRAGKPCSTTGCPEIVPAGTGRCSECRRRAERVRGTATQRGYGGRAWQATRRAFLRQPQNKICAIRGPKCTVVATVPDHWPDSRKDLIARGVPDPDAFHRLRPACVACHNAATAENQPGGFRLR